MAKSIAQYIEESQNPSSEESGYVDLINKLITIINEDHDIYVGTTPPLPPNEDGDLWYQPVEDRYYAYVT